MNEYNKNKMWEDMIAVQSYTQDFYFPLFNKVKHKHILHFFCTHDYERIHVLYERFTLY